MQEEKRNVTEETVQLIDLLEAENEEKLTKVIEAIQDVEQKSREIQLLLQQVLKRLIFVTLTVTEPSRYS